MSATDTVAKRAALSVAWILGIGSYLGSWAYLLATNWNTPVCIAINCSFVFGWIGVVLLVIGAFALVKWIINGNSR